MYHFTGYVPKCSHRKMLSCGWGLQVCFLMVLTNIPHQFQELTRQGIYITVKSLEKKPTASATVARYIEEAPVK
jgi:hypothetical protein